MALEFRVQWQREGKYPKTLIYQSWHPAIRKVRHLKALDAVKDDFDAYDDMPRIVDGPTLQVREVGEWRRHDYQPLTTEGDVENAREHAEFRDAEIRAKKGEVPAGDPWF
jgi:hypothetical protein